MQMIGILRSERGATARARMADGAVLEIIYPNTVSDAQILADIHTCDRREAEAVEAADNADNAEPDKAEDFAFDGNVTARAAEGQEEAAPTREGGKTDNHTQKQAKKPIAKKGARK